MSFCCRGALGDRRAHERPLLIIYTAAFDGRPNGAQLSELALYLHDGVHHKLDAACKPGRVARADAEIFSGLLEEPDDAFITSPLMWQDAADRLANARAWRSDRSRD